MMLVTNSQQFEELRIARQLELCEDLIEVQKRHIRSRFDSSTLDCNAQASIDMARTMGFDELVADMESDLETERILSLITNL